MNVWKEIIEFLLNFQHLSLKEKVKTQESFKIWH